MGRADVPGLDLQLVHPQRQAVTERDRRRPQRDVAPFDSREDRLDSEPGRQHPLATALVPDDRRRRRQHEVAPGVVAVLVSVDERADRQSGHLAYRVQQGTGPALGVARIYQRDGAAADDEGAVVQPPLAVELEVRVDALADLLDRRRPRWFGALVDDRSGPGCQVAAPAGAPNSHSSPPIRSSASRPVSPGPSKSPSDSQRSGLSPTA
jgi:hypothetical protein